MDERRRRLMDALLEVAGTHGMRQARLQEVCEQAGLIARYFYESFDNMQELYDAVQRDVLDSVVERVWIAVDGVPRDLRSVAEAALRAFFTFIQDDTRRAPFLSGQRSQGALPAGDPFVAMLDRLLRQAYPWIGHLPGAEHLAHGLAGMLAYPAAAWVGGGMRQSVEQMVQASMAIVSGVDEELRRELDRLSP